MAPRDLDAAARALAGRTGIGPVRAAIAQADGRAESVGESPTGYIVRALGFELEPQHEIVVEGRRFRADFRVEGTRVLLEFDGRVKYAERRHDKRTGRSRPPLQYRVRL